MSTSSPTSLDALRQRLETTLFERIPAAHSYPPRLHEALRYAAEGGKRLRALLVYAGGLTLDVPLAALDAPACAVELIHAYSLVHDDLPAMDDDPLRRGRPTVHITYDEAMGILVGDAMQTLAFELLAQDHEGAANPTQRLAMVAALAQASGSRGMVGGQVVDMASEGKRITLPELEALHIHKTGALILSSLRMACCAKTHLEAAHKDALDHFGKAIGLAFQIQDDVLDEESSTEKLGKTQGKDKAQEKSTYVSLLGLNEAKERAADLFTQAHTALDIFGDKAEPLRELARLIQRRDH